MTTTQTEHGARPPGTSLAEASGSRAACVRVRGLFKAYAGRPALRGLDLELAPGEALGLLGPNGAGKTTLMHLLAGVLAPDAGSIELAGLGAPTRPSARARIGIAPQALGLYPQLTAEENLEFFGDFYGLRGALLRERVEQGLLLADLRARRHDRVACFSGGMARRLNIATAVLHEPCLLLLDEPTAGVDPQSRNHVFETVERLRDAGMTILYSTHFMQEAERLCDRVAIVDQGRLLALDTPRALCARYGGGTRVSAALRPPLLRGSSLLHRLDEVSASPERVVAGLLAEGASLHELRVTQPTLEDVFLTLTGKQLRDEA